MAGFSARWSSRKSHVNATLPTSWRPSRRPSLGSGVVLAQAAVSILRHARKMHVLSQGTAVGANQPTPCVDGWNLLPFSAAKSHGSHDVAGCAPFINKTRMPRDDAVPHSKRYKYVHNHQSLMSLQGERQLSAYTQLSRTLVLISFCSRDFTTT